VTTASPRATLEAELRAAVAEGGRQIPVVVGLCGAGRTTILRRLESELGPGRCQYINVERTATTPERFLGALTDGSLHADGLDTPAAGPRPAFDAILAFFAGARCPDQGPVTFLLDELLEFRTFESFPGLRRALPELLAALASSPNRFVLASRYLTRTERALAAASPHFAMVTVPGLDTDEVGQMLAGRPDGRRSTPAPGDSGGEDGVARVVLGLTAGRPAYARALVDMMTTLDARSDGDPVAALAALLEPGSRLCSLCGYSYELRLHRARGYGALKAILDILATSEPLTLTEISHRLGRTPGSTKDYLSWLEDVDLVAAVHKRYRFRDPLLRVWVRLHCRPSPPRPEDIGREVQLYAASCLPDLARAVTV
jgi:hypothetical protein